MKEIFSSDNSISTLAEDRFQRKPFAVRVADAIIGYNDSSSLVIAIYGEWGSGKTSVLNMIGEAIKEKQADNYSIIHFNPWRYKDELALLNAFFNQLRNNYDESKDITKKCRKKILKSFDEYSIGIGAEIPVAGVKAGLNLKFKPSHKLNLEGIKAQLDDFISKRKDRIIIMLDDIDRLDKDEIYSLLKLVRLNANFPHTIYVLACDKKEVANAICKHFNEEGNVNTGMDFLEKIIQIPLELPTILVTDLRKYLIDNITPVIDENYHEKDKNDFRVFIQHLNDVLVFLNTPRAINRYINGLKFAIPMISKEVNASDLFLIEVIRISLPDVYNFIRNDSNYFLYSYSDSNNSFLQQKNNERKNNYLSWEGKLIHRLKIEEKRARALNNILETLFPYLRETKGKINRSLYSSNWIKDKRISSARYFDRYFMYTVLDGDLSDTVFNELIEGIAQCSIDKSLPSIVPYLDKYEDALRLLLQVHYTEYDWSLIRKLGIIISRNGDRYNNEGTFGFTSRRSYCDLLLDMLKDKSPKLNKSLDEVLVESDSIGFLDEIINDLKYRIDHNEIDLDQKDLDNVVKIIICKIKKVCVRKPYFCDLGLVNGYVLAEWKKLDQQDFDNYYKSFVDNNPKLALNIITSCITLAKPLLSEEAYYKVSLSQQNYDEIKAVYDVDYVYRNLCAAYPNYIQINNNVNLNNQEKKVEDDKDYIGQFVELYKKNHIRDQIY